MTRVGASGPGRVLEVGGATALAGACAHAAAMLLIDRGLGAAAPGAGLIAIAVFWIAYRVLCAVGGGGCLTMASFIAAPLPDSEVQTADELLLEDVHLAAIPVAVEEAEPEPDVLELDDILAAVSPNARVVHLFDSAAMPTPGQLRDRIERHLDPPHAEGLPDASDALHQALAELRRSLR